MDSSWGHLRASGHCASRRISLLELTTKVDRSAQSISKSTLDQLNQAHKPCVLAVEPPIYTDLAVLAAAIESSLPQNVSGFKRNCHAIVMRDQARRIVRRWANCRHLRAIGTAACCARRLPHALHLLPHRSATADSVGVELDP